MRFTLLPDPRFEELAAPLAQRMEEVARLVTWQALPALLDSTARGMLETAFTAAGADEGTIWMVDAAEEALVPAYNTGPDAEGFVGQFRQPLRQGLISMVFATQQLFCDNQVERNEIQDRRLDQQLGKVTAAMIAVPFQFARASRGVISCVQLRVAGAPGTRPGFQPDALRHVQRAAVLLGQLIDHRLLSATVGWTER